ncbi:PRK06851 family protein [Clostridium sp. B9]|uniref:PRK06851 family protein n=1 Tax=Clostridium sp. B9 TaxID=3423224 RepID=UPI003D2EBB01
MKKIVYYYGAGNTSKGFKPLYNSIFQGLDKIYSLNGGSNIFKTAILKEIIDEYGDKFNLEVLVSAIDNNECEGVIIKEKNIAIINGTPLHGTMNLIKDNIEEIDLDLFLDMKKIEENKNNIITLKSEFDKCMIDAHNEFSKALKIHDYWEDIYFAYLNFNKANKLTDHIVSLLTEGFNKKEVVGKIVDRYLGAATPTGSKDFVPNITDGVKRYFIKGRPGTGKSTMLKKIAKAITEYGYDIEIYSCGFDPDSKDMVISRDLNFAIFDSTAPHEYFPSKEDDEIIDVYDIYVDGDVDKIHKEELDSISQNYKKQVGKGTEFLLKGEEVKNKLDEIYNEAFDHKSGKSELDFLFNENNI